jgi:hypothetical protein
METTEYTEYTEKGQARLGVVRHLALEFISLLVVPSSFRVFSVFRGLLHLVNMPARSGDLGQHFFGLTGDPC